MGQQTIPGKKKSVLALPSDALSIFLGFKELCRASNHSTAKMKWWGGRWTDLAPRVAPPTEGANSKSPISFSGVARLWCDKTSRRTDGAEQGQKTSEGKKAELLIEGPTATVEFGSTEMGIGEVACPSTQGIGNGDADGAGKNTRNSAWRQTHMG